MSKTAQVVKDSHPDWQAFNGKAAQAVVFSNYAYSQKDEEMQAMADQVKISILGKNKKEVHKRPYDI